MDAEEAQKRRAERLLVLRTLYVLSGGSTNAMVEFRRLMSKTLIPRDRLESHVEYLRGENLAEWAAMGMVSISHDGVKEIEDALDAPEKPTEHFPAILVAQNYVSIEGDVSGQVQVGTSNSTQSMGILTDDLGALIAEVRGVLVDLPLNPDEGAEIESDLRTVEVQLESPKPKKGILRAALSSARTVLEAATAKEAAAATTAGAEHLPDLIEKLGHAITLLS